MKINTANTILYCAHWTETVLFYRDVLKLAETFANDWFVEFALTDGARLSVADETRASVKSSGGQGITLSFHVDDVAALRHSLITLKLEPSPMKTRWGARVFYLYDPEGNRIEFWR